MISRCYLEITNICNLDCVFCPKNARPKRRMTVEEFDFLTDRLRGQIKFLYFHLMGEPMLHPNLNDFIRMAKAKGFTPILTTNGTLLDRGLEEMPYKVQISLHAHEGNAMNDAAGYVDRVMRFVGQAAEAGSVVVLRFWNQGGFDSDNHHLMDLIAQHIPRPWTERYDGWKLAERVYVEYDQMFEWPEDDRAECAETEFFCYALRNQVGVLVDGTVVPCCLDHEGSVPLGNLHQQTLQEILSSPRACALYDGFSHHQATEPFCRRCEYAAVTKRFRRPK